MSTDINGPDSKTHKKKRDKSGKEKKKRDKHHGESSTKKRARDEHEHDSNDDRDIMVPDSQPSPYKKQKHEHGLNGDKSKHRSKATSYHDTTSAAIPANNGSSSSSSSLTNPATTITMVPQTQQTSTTPQQRHPSPFVSETHSFYLALSPCSLLTPVAGLCAEHISPQLLTYSPQLRGVLLAYSDARTSEDPYEGNDGTHDHNPTPSSPPLDSGGSDSSSVLRNQAGGMNKNKTTTTKKVVLAHTFNEYGVAFLWLTAKFLIFRPRRGCVLDGFVNLQNESMLGLICYNYFNAGIERAKLPPDWTWVEHGKGDWDEKGEKSLGRNRLDKGGKMRGDGLGYYVNGNGDRVQGRLTFWVDDFDAAVDSSDPGGGGSVSIAGTMIPPAKWKQVRR